MLWAYLPNPNNEQVRKNIENSAESIGAMGQNFLAWMQYGRVNLYDALVYTPGGPDPEDTTPPVISNVSAVNANGPFFEISWQTDEPATSLLILPCCGDVGDAALVTQHRLRFRGKKGVSYEFYVSSIDAAGNEAIAGPFTHQN
jgi:thermolysin